jgi:hypothetical protein
MLPIVRIITLAFLDAHVCNLVAFTCTRVQHGHNYKSLPLRLCFEIVGETSDFPQNSETETRMETPQMPLIGWLRYDRRFQFPISQTAKVEYGTALRASPPGVPNHISNPKKRIGSRTPPTNIPTTKKMDWILRWNRFHIPKLPDLEREP